jgi:hypothetical protein
LVYSWVMLDQELSLFYDCNPIFKVTELGISMPDLDCLWHAKSAIQWTSVFNQVYSFAEMPSIGTSVRPLSLRDVFRYFINGDIQSRGLELTALQLRLLLSPLQAMVGQFQQFSNYLFDENDTSPNDISLTIRKQYGDIHVLLERWQELANRYLLSQPSCAMIQASLVMYHLISLSVVSNLQEIERMTRNENVVEECSLLMFLRNRCITNSPEAVFHAGQIMQLIRSMPVNIRPPWWPGAIYRSVLVLWAEGLIEKETANSPPSDYHQAGPSIMIDSLPASHPVLVQYRSTGQGVPCLSGKTLTVIQILNRVQVLLLGVEILDGAIANRFSDGIRNRLENLACGG